MLYLGHWTVLNITRNKNFETLQSSGNYERHHFIKTLEIYRINLGSHIVDSSASFSMSIQIKEIYLWLRAIDVAKKTACRDCGYAAQHLIRIFIRSRHP